MFEGDELLDEMLVELLEGDSTLSLEEIDELDNFKSADEIAYAYEMMPEASEDVMITAEPEKDFIEV